MVFSVPFKIVIPSAFRIREFPLAVKEALSRSIRYGQYSINDIVQGHFVQPPENAPIVQLIKQLDPKWIMGKNIFEQMQEIDVQHNSSLCSEVKQGIVECFDRYIQQPKFMGGFHFDYMEWLDPDQVFSLLNKKAFLTEHSLFCFILLNYTNNSQSCLRSLLDAIESLNSSQKITLLSSIPQDFLIKRVLSSWYAYGSSSDRTMLDEDLRCLILAMIQFIPSTIDYVDAESNSNLLMTIASTKPDSFKEIFEQLDKTSQARMLQFTSGIKTNLLTTAISSKNKELFKYVLKQYENILGNDKVIEMVLNTEQYCTIEAAFKYQPSAMQFLLSFLNEKQKSEIFTSPIYQDHNYLMKVPTSTDPSLAYHYFMLSTNSDQQYNSLIYCSPHDGNHALLVSLSRYLTNHDGSKRARTIAYDGVKCILNLMTQMSNEQKTKYLSHVNCSGNTSLTYLLMLSLDRDKPLGNLLDFFAPMIQDLTHEQQASLLVPLLHQFGSTSIVNGFGAAMGDVLAAHDIVIHDIEHAPKRMRSASTNPYRFSLYVDMLPQTSSRLVSDELNVIIENRLDL